MQLPKLFPENEKEKVFLFPPSEVVDKSEEEQYWSAIELHHWRKFSWLVYRFIILGRRCFVFMLSWRNKKSKLQSETHYTTDSRDERERLVKKASGGSSQLYGIECRWPTTRRVHYEVMHRKYLWPSGKDSTHHAIINSGRKVINGFIKNMLMFQLRRSLFLLSSQMRLRRLATLLFTVQVNFLNPSSSCFLRKKCEISISANYPRQFTRPSRITLILLFLIIASTSERWLKVNTKHREMGYHKKINSEY